MRRNITLNILKRLRPEETAYFIRSTTLQGFGIKVNPSGSIRFIAEGKCQGVNRRKTLGSYPQMALDDAENEAVLFLNRVHSGSYEQPTTEVSLHELFKDYLKGDRLKPGTKKDYESVIPFYLKDWLNKPVASITKQMVEKRFYQIRDKGMFGGIPTYSSATKTMRILSALMNYARADELIDSNPVDVLKYKRVDRSMRKRDNYLKLEEARELLHITAQETHPVTLAIHLMLHTGLRKNEALRLKWSDFETIDGIECLLIRDTKNHRPHYVPITDTIKIILEKTTSSSNYVFPSPSRKNCNVTDERPTINRLSKSLGVEFRCHDLRRTFATRASEVGIDFGMIKRLLNHKSNDITAQYIQWNSSKNLSVMKQALESILY